jgi:plastocyanin
MASTRLTSILGVGLLAVGLAACGGTSGDSGSSGSGGGTAPNPTAAVKIMIDYDPANTGKYVPTPATAKVGDIVEWQFTDDQGGPHTVTSDDGSTFDSQSKNITGNKGDKFNFTFTKAGTYAYHCTYHANMKGSITIQ